MQAQLNRIKASADLSKDVYEIVEKSSIWLAIIINEIKMVSAHLFYLFMH